MYHTQYASLVFRSNTVCPNHADLAMCNLTVRSHLIISFFLLKLNDQHDEIDHALGFIFTIVAADRRLCMHSAPRRKRCKSNRDAMSIGHARNTLLCIDNNTLLRVHVHRITSDSLHLDVPLRADIHRLSAYACR